MTDGEYSRIDMRAFHENNAAARLTSQDDSEVVLKLWGTDDLRFVVDDLGPAPHEVLNNIRIDPRFDAVIHTDSHLVEFLFSYVAAEDEWGQSIIDRRFVVNFLDVDIECWFGEPTERAMALSKASRRLPSDVADRVAPQLQLFRDAQRQDDMPAAVGRFFADKQPRNFFVSVTSIPTVDLRELARHINMLSSYYDRRAPYIVIRNAPATVESRPKPTRYINDAFPARLTVRDIDEVLLTLLEVAGNSSSRPAFLYYYQVFEYAGHYYIDEKTRRSLKRLLRDPSLASCDDRKVGELFSILGDLHHHEDQRMQRVVEEHVDPLHLWPDVQNDIEFFSKPVTFDGGLSLDRLVSGQATPDTWADAFKSLFPTLTRIRNCIVHAREKRESKVILPTAVNAVLLSRYIPLIRRMAEDVAFRT